MKSDLAHSQQKVPSIAPGMLPGDSRTCFMLEEAISEIAHSPQARAMANLFLGASLRLYKGFLDGYTDLHVFLVQSPGEGIGSPEARDVDVGLVHYVRLGSNCENW